MVDDERMESVQNEWNKIRPNYNNMLQTYNYINFKKYRINIFITIIDVALVLILFNIHVNIFIYKYFIFIEFGGMNINGIL